MNKNLLNVEIDNRLIDEILNDPQVMVAVTRQSILYFFYIYFGSYIKYPMAPFHKEMFSIAQDDSLKRAGVVAFRGSAKSTILNTAYALWAIMGILQKKHVVIASQTQQRAKDHLRNIRKEIEDNPLLRKYLGPFEEKEDQWHSTILIIPKYGARISAISVDEGIRGLKEGPNRPDLIIVDDIEDSASSKTKEGRDKTFNWLTGELLPLGDINTKAVFLGNYLHEDSVLMRIEKLMKEKDMPGKFLRIPLVDSENNIAWPTMFPSLETVENMRKSIGNDILWYREYLLKYMPSENQIVKPEDIHYYDEIPRVDYQDGKDIIEVSSGRTGVGVDLAISKNSSADYTAMVIGKVVYFNEEPRIYILPDPVNRRLSFLETIQYAQALSKSNSDGKRFFVENVGYQQAAIEEMERQLLDVLPMKPNGDKESRVHVISTYIKGGTVLFPRRGCEDLIRQLIYFGTEHDDLVDALAYLILGLAENMHYPKMWFI